MVSETDPLIWLATAPRWWSLTMSLVMLASCSSEIRPVEPPVPPVDVNLLADQLEDGIPKELQSFAAPTDGYLIGRVDGGHCDDASLLVIGEGEYGGANVGRVVLKGRQTYIASAFVDSEAGQSLLKLDYYDGKKLLGNTTSLPARNGGWQQLSVLSQRSLYPRATHVVVVAVCRGKSQARFDDFALVTYPAQ